mmetsp:Transcript_110983/g.220739  ORF Transcript_110983/g.220739 Transcript_110983/m.220739 type:complete len:111 (-) Transcript_110983:211-543(-)
MQASTTCGRESSVKITGMSGELCCLSAKSLWSIAKLRQLVAHALNVPAAELILLDGEKELQDQNKVGEIQQLTAVRISSSAAQWRAKQHMKCMGTSVLQRAKMLVSQRSS